MTATNKEKARILELLDWHLEKYADYAGQGDYWAGRYDAIEDAIRSINGEEVWATHDTD